MSGIQKLTFSPPADLPSPLVSLARSLLACSSARAALHGRLRVSTAKTSPPGVSRPFHATVLPPRTRPHMKIIESPSALPLSFVSRPPLPNSSVHLMYLYPLAGCACGCRFAHKHGSSTPATKGCSPPPAHAQPVYKRSAEGACATHHSAIYRIPRELLRTIRMTCAIEIYAPDATTGIRSAFDEFEDMVSRPQDQKKRGHRYLHSRMQCSCGFNSIMYPDLLWACPPCF